MNNRNIPDHCPLCGSDQININLAEDNYACNTEGCELYHGSQALFEKEYINWHKDKQFWDFYEKFKKEPRTHFIYLKSEIPDETVEKIKKEFKEAIEDRNKSNWIQPLNI